MMAGVVLAAGRSRRMGTPKPLLTLEGRTLLGRAIATLRTGGCSRVLAVVGLGEEAVARAAREEGAQMVINPQPDSEQIDSLRVALQSLPAELEAAVVTPVDVPRIEAATVAALIAAFRLRRAPIVLPSYGGRHGHPTLFARRVWPELLADPLPEGARSVVHAHAAELEAVPVHDAGVLVDVDTPEDFRRLERR